MIITKKDSEKSSAHSLVQFQLISRLFGMLKNVHFNKPNLVLQMLSTEDVLEGSLCLAIAKQDIAPGTVLSLNHNEGFQTFSDGRAKIFTDFDWLT